LKLTSARLRAFLPVVAALVIGASNPVPAIRLNQLGFLPDTTKRAVVATESTVPLRWRVLDANGRTAAEGRTTVIGADAASGDGVHLVSFDGVTAPGTYRIEVAGQTSRTFAVRTGLYAPLASAALNFFYQNRAGIPIEARYAGGAQWARPAGHPKEVAPCFKGADERGTVWPGCSYWPTRRFDQLEIDRFNAAHVSDYLEIRDFLVLHYKATERADTPFWDYCRTLEPPPGLASKLAVFGANGRIFREGNELFTETSWLSVMVGQGVEAGGYHPAADLLSDAETLARLQHIRQVVADTASLLPHQDEYLRQIGCDPAPRLTVA
jgi:hypothetical protein